MNTILSCLLSPASGPFAVWASKSYKSENRLLLLEQTKAKLKEGERVDPKVPAC